MGISWGILLIIMGVLAAYSLIVAKKPDAAELLGKITPYQGYIGIIGLLWGLWGILWTILSIGWISVSIFGLIWWITLLGGSVISVVLGFILGYGLITKYALSKNEEAKEKGAKVLAKLAPIQGTLGIIAIAGGIWVIVSWILF